MQGTRHREVHNNPVFPTGGGGSEEQSMGEETGGSVANRTWVDREYVHTTGYVDEIACETDEFEYPWYHLQDANYNVVAIAHESGFVASQRTFDPYGQVIRHQQFLGHPPSRAGHQGLFFDRLDAGLTASGRLPESLVTTAGAGGTTPVAVLGVYQNRERTYLPHLGRFGQGDPNGTAAAVFASMHSAGSGFGVEALHVSTDSIFGDGPNRHIAYGAAPLHRQDPSGLFFGGVVGLFAPTSTIDIYTDYNMDALQNGFGAFNQLSGMLQGYSIDMELDVEWASDWSGSDLDYGASGAGPMQAALAAAALTGVQHTHHIASNKHSRYTPLFRQLFARANPPIGMNNVANLMPIDTRFHRGPHTDSYHRRIFHRLARSIYGVTDPKMIRRLLLAELDLLKTDIRVGLVRNPDFLRNRDGRMPGRNPMPWRRFPSDPRPRKW
ncbi:MAG: AHH domain-containing protein [Phycisphaerales bacterium]